MLTPGVLSYLTLTVPALRGLSSRPVAFTPAPGKQIQMVFFVCFVVELKKRLGLFRNTEFVSFSYYKIFKSNTIIKLTKGKQKQYNCLQYVFENIYLTRDVDRTVY